MVYRRDMVREIHLKTEEKVEMVDITAEVREGIKAGRLQSGTAFIYCPHTTAAVTINEGADPDVTGDMLAEINKIVPFADGYRHREGNSAAHIKASLFGPGETAIVEEGRIQLGRWQSIYFCEFDGPRERKVYLKLIPDKS